MAHKGRKDTGSLKVEHPLTGPASACRLPSDMFPAQTRGDKDRLIFSVRLEKERGTADTIGVCVGWLWQQIPAKSCYSLRCVIHSSRGIGPRSWAPLKSQAA